MMGVWQGIEVWTQPFTEEQAHRLATVPDNNGADGRVSVVAVRPELCGGQWLVFALPAPTDGWVDECEDGEAWEVQFGTMTTRELGNISDDFMGW